VQFIHQINEPKVYEGVPETIKKIFDRGIEMVILSSDFCSTLFPAIDNAGFALYFKEIIGEVYDKRTVIEDVLARNRFCRPKTAFVGDTPNDIETGQMAGLQTVAIAWGFNNREKLLQLNADYTIDNIAQLLPIVFP
jgi:phosphoglycolate phosphatase-like HAD superfamily hydrolase